MCFFLSFVPPVSVDMHAAMTNDKSSATRRTGRNDGNRDAPAGFAAAHG